ncbi:MAG TPA: hypothetical protein V6C78_21870, partial [Crinalium sp.]
MSIEYLQNLHDKLQRRIDRLIAFDVLKRADSFYFLLKQYWFFLHSHPVIASILDELSYRFNFL